VVGYLVPGNRRGVHGTEASAEQGKGLRGIGEGVGDDGIKAAEQSVVEQCWVFGHRDDKAFRLGLIEERQEHVENASCLPMSCHVSCRASIASSPSNRYTVRVRAITSKMTRSFTAVSPAYLLVSASSRIVTRGSDSSAARADAVIDFPVPGGPVSSSR